jgi:hypothetical protein
VESEKHSKAREWLEKSGYGLEMRVAAACRRPWLLTTQSVPYVDPTQQDKIREADVVVRFDGQLTVREPNISGIYLLAAVIECKSSMAKPWVALLVSDSVSGNESILIKSKSVDKESFDRLIRGSALFSQAPAADALVSAHEQDQRRDPNTAGSALRQSMSAASGIHEQFDQATQHELDPIIHGYLVLTLPVLVTAGELYGATLGPAGEIQVEDLAHVFVKTSRPGGPSSRRPQRGLCARDDLRVLHRIFRARSRRFEKRTSGIEPAFHTLMACPRLTSCYP